MNRDERGISNALNILLLVGLALLVGFLFMQFAFSNFSLFDAGPSAQFTFETDGDDLEITFERGERLDGSQVLVVRSDRTVADTWADSACVAPVAELSAGDTCVVPGAASAESVLVVWRSDEGREYVLGRWRKSRGGVGLPVGDVDGGSGSGSGGSAGSAGDGSGGAAGSGGSSGGDGSGGGDTAGGSDGGVDAGGDDDASDGSDRDGPESIRTRVGDGPGEAQFTNASAWHVEARYGGDDTWELAANNRTRQYDWTNGTVETFSLTYDGTGNVSFVIDNSTTRVGDVATPTGSVAITVTAVNATDERNVSVFDLRLDGTDLDDPAVTTTDGSQYVLIETPGAADGFLLTGRLRLVWDGAEPPADGLRVTIHAES